MALDGLVIHAVVHELQCLIGCRAGKIHQPSKHDIFIPFRVQGENRKLLLSAHPTYPRVHFTDSQPANPPEPPTFCMLLRKHCEGALVEAISQVGMERIIRIRLKQRDELGDIRLKTIVIEIMGRHSNIILMDEDTGIILDGIHHVTPAISQFRLVLPGQPYVAPPDQGKENPLHVSESRFIELLRENSQAAAEQEELAAGLLRSFSGISPLAAREIVYRSHPAGRAADISAVWTSFRAWMDDVRGHRYRPTIKESGEGKSFFAVFPILHISGDETAYDSIGPCLDDYYRDKAGRDLVKQRVSDLLRLMQNEKNKNAKKLEKLRQTIEQAKEADKFRICGELLTASLHLCRRGDAEVEAVNYYDEAQKRIRIGLDPRLSPSENAQKYFKKYNKAKNSLSVVGEQIAAAEIEMKYLDSILHQLEYADLSDVEEIREELAEQGYIRRRNVSRTKKKKTARPLLTCISSSEGVPIYVGKNNLQNEYLTNRLAAASDTWLHTKDIPGSHVVIKSRDFNEDTLNTAAQLAAYYSQARESSRVPVDYTLIRHVRKPNGAKPGYVIYDHQKTLYVTPDEQMIKQLNAKTV